MNNTMEFPDTWEEFAEDYGFFDNQGVYTNGSLLIPEFRVRQWLEHISTVKNNLDLIDRAKAQTEIEMNACRYTLAKESGGTGKVEWSDILIKVSDAIDIIRNLPPVTPTRKKGKWIVNKERDTICCPYCHDKQKIGKDEVELLKTAFTGFKFCKYCGAEMESEE